jgi:ribosome biogenesis protein SSF1/2
MQVNECRRVVLFQFDPETGDIELRHYYIDVKLVGVSKSVKRIVQPSQSQIPNLHSFNDVSDYVLR